MFVRKMVSFELGEEIEIFFVLSRAWDKEKILSPTCGIEPHTFKFRAPILYHQLREYPLPLTFFT